jgi:hypothetical protein
MYKVHDELRDEDILQIAWFYVTNDLPKYHRLNMSLVDGNPVFEHLKEDVERLNEQAYYMGIIEGINRKKGLKDIREIYERLNEESYHMRIIEGRYVTEREMNSNFELSEQNLKPVIQLLKRHGQPDDIDCLFAGLGKLRNVGFQIGLYGDTSEEDLPHLYGILYK